MGLEDLLTAENFAKLGAGLQAVFGGGGASTPAPGYYPGAVGMGYPTPEVTPGNFYRPVTYMPAATNGATTSPNAVEQFLQSIVPGGEPGLWADGGSVCVRQTATAPSMRWPAMFKAGENKSGGQTYYLRATVSSGDIKKLVRSKATRRRRCASRCRPR